MDTTTALLFWTAAFLGTHVGLSSTRVRPRLVALLGPGGYAGLFSLVAFATFVPLVTVWMRSIHGGGLLWNLRGVPGVTTVALLLSWVSFTMALAALVQPSPAAMGPRKRVRAYGLTRVTRHPLFMNIGIWGLAHVLVNGYLHDVLFFGGVFVSGLLGCLHQDARKRVTEKGQLDEFLDETSVIPFVAIATGRNKLVLSEMPWIAIAVGAAASWAIYVYHTELFF